MQKFVAEHNIERYEALLSIETDGKKIQTLRRLLDEERKKLRTIKE